MFGKLKVVFLFALGVTGASALYSVETSRAEAGRRPNQPEHSVHPVNSVHPVINEGASPRSIAYRDEQVTATADEILLDTGKGKSARASLQNVSKNSDLIAGAKAQQNSGLNDPLAWLEGPANCAAIQSGMTERYGELNSGARQIQAQFAEELRHLRGYTCADAKFQTCSFSWCNSAVAKKSEEPKSGRQLAAVSTLRNTAADIEQELAKKLQDNLVMDAQATKVRSTEEKKLVTQASKKAEIVSWQSPGGFMDLPKDAPTAASQSNADPVGIVAQAQAEARGEFFTGEDAINVHLAEQAKQLSVLKLAEEQLKQLVLEKRTIVNGQQTAKIATEQKKRADWLRIVVPGSERMPRPRKAVGDVVSSQVIGGAAGGRTIAPTVGSVPASVLGGNPSSVGAQIPLNNALQPQLGRPDQAPRPGTDHLTAEREKAIRDQYKGVLQQGMMAQEAMAGGSRLTGR